VGVAVACVYLDNRIYFVFNIDNMASQSTGIQQLLAAEKKSAEKVAEARKRT